MVDGIVRRRRPRGRRSSYLLDTTCRPNDAAAQAAACEAAGVDPQAENVEYDDETGACTLDSGGSDEGEAGEERAENVSGEDENEVREEFRRLLADPRVKGWRKAAIIVLIGYLASPIDLVPDFIPVAGQLDDAILVALVLRTVLRGGGPELLREHWPGPQSSLAIVSRLAYGEQGRDS